MQRHLMQVQSIVKGSRCEYIETDGACLLDIGAPLDYGQDIGCSFYVGAWPTATDSKIWSRGDEELLIDTSRRYRGCIFYDSTNRQDFRGAAVTSTYRYGYVEIEKRALAASNTMHYNTGTTPFKSASWSKSTSIVYRPTFSSPTLGNVSMFGKIDDESAWMPSGSRIYFVTIDEAKWLPWYLDGEYGLMRQDTGEFFGKSYGTGTLTGVIL